MGCFRCTGSSSKKSEDIEQKDPNTFNSKTHKPDDRTPSDKAKVISNLVKRDSDVKVVVSKNDQLALDVKKLNLKNEVSEEGEANGRAKTFTFEELAAATGNFRSDCFLGEGGFGKVYKGYLEKVNEVVAIKQLDRNGLQGIREFVVEVLTLSLADHPNLVKLIGFCAEGDQRLLVYEYMPLGSLENHLHDLRPGAKVIDWNTRMKIAAGAARGLEYLHEKMKPPVIYRDLKCSNILLGEGYHPKLSDFGLAKVGPSGDKTHVSTRVMGTLKPQLPTSPFQFSPYLPNCNSISSSMDVVTRYRPNQLLSPATPFLQQSQNVILFTLPAKRRAKYSRQRAKLRVLGSADGNAADESPFGSFSRSVRRGSERFWLNFGESIRKETGFGLKNTDGRLVEFFARANERLENMGPELQRLKNETLPEFITWNRWDRWKDFKNWEPKRVGALFLYALVMIVSCQRIYMSVRVPFVNRERLKLTEAYMEALIPEPSPNNIRKFKKGLWRKTMPKGLKIKKFIEGTDGTLVQDSSYVGEDAWDDDSELLQDNVKKIIDSDEKIKGDEKEKIKEQLEISGQKDSGTWRERLQTWKEILRKEKLTEAIDSLRAKYVVEFDMKEVEKSLRKDVVEKKTDTQGTRALWVSKRWWHYRPKLPYTYFLDKLDSSEVAAVVFTEDMKRLFVTMKEGFPLEYTVDIPLDPYLFEAITGSGVEVDLLQKRQIHYFLKVLIALLPGLLILWFIRESVMLLSITTKRLLYKKYQQLFDMEYTENFILPIGNVGDGETTSMHKEVVLGGDVWDLLDELMIYIQNPMQYYEKRVPFVRGVLLSGPPGTGKTLFARTLSKQSGLPFVYASGAEFTDSEKSGAARINEIFSIARRNAPSFIFVDEIDAIAGRHARNDPRRRATFEALIAQLDGEKETTGIDRFSLRQAVIFICATNRPDELDLEFVRSGRIDRRLYIGLPDAKQRVKIFGVHSAGKQLAEDIDFGKLVYRTVGFSGADIRNLVNEAAIMSVRKGHSRINQQDLVDVLDKQLLEGMGVLLTAEEQQKCEERVSIEKRRLLAVHEAGHILLAHLFPRFDWHAFSQLLPGGKETAISVFFPREDMVGQGYTTFGYLKMQMVVAHGGRCAERLIFGNDITDGGKDDLEKITKIAREMVISPQNSRLGLAALTKKFGMTDQPDNPDGELIRYTWDDPRVTPVNMTLELSELFSRELARYIEETEELAMNGLRENKHILDMITEELLNKSRMTGLEVIEKMKDLAPSMFEDFIKPIQIDLDVEGALPHKDKLRYQPLVIYPAPLHRC